ncbi:MAG: preprotein translocase subunit YajC [Bacteroidia bacterium]
MNLETVQPLIMMGLVMIVIYFFMLRPQMKKAKDEKKYREALKKGDRIVTIGGIHGKINEIRDDSFIIEVEGNNRLKIEKSAVSMTSSATLNEVAK